MHNFNALYKLYNIIELGKCGKSQVKFSQCKTITIAVRHCIGNKSAIIITGDCIVFFCNFMMYIEREFRIISYINKCLPRAEIVRRPRWYINNNMITKNIID